MISSIWSYDLPMSPAIPIKIVRRPITKENWNTYNYDNSLSQIFVLP